MSLNKRLNEEAEQQKQEGYSVKGIFKGYENYLIYREVEREVTAELEFISDFTGETKLFRNSYRKWDKPRGEELTPFDIKKLRTDLLSIYPVGAAKSFLMIRR